MTAEKRQPSTAGQRQAAAGVGAEEAALIARVNALAAETPHSEGRRRLAKPWQDEVVAVGRCHARRLMQQAGVAVCRAMPRHPITPNLLARPCDEEYPAHVGGGDSTDVWTAEAWWYGSVR